VGYKKHTLRCGCRRYETGGSFDPAGQLGHTRTCARGLLLKPSIRQCQQRLAGVRILWWATWGYIHQQTKQEISSAWNVAVVTKLKCDMRIIEPFDAWDQMSCQQGQALQWLATRSRLAPLVWCACG